MDSNLMAALVGVFAALAGAAVGGAATWLVHVRAQKEDRLGDFRQAVIDMLDQRIRHIVEMGAIPDPAVRGQLGILYGSRLSTLRSIAESLLESVADRLTYQDWLVIGYEAQLAANYSTAHRYYEAALRKSDTEEPVDLAIAIRHLAQLHYVEANPFHDLAAGERLFEQAIGVTGASTDPWLQYTTGRTYALWAQTLADTGQATWRDKAELARSYFLAMPAGRADRQFELDSLEAWIARLSGATAPGEATASAPAAARPAGVGDPDPLAAPATSWRDPTTSQGGDATAIPRQAEVPPQAELPSQAEVPSHAEVSTQAELPRQAEPESRDAEATAVDPQGPDLRSREP